MPSEAIENSTTIIKAQSFPLAALPIRRSLERLNRAFRVIRQILKPSKLRERFGIYENPEPRRNAKIFFTIDDHLLIIRTEPGRRIFLRQRELIGELDFLKCEVASVFMIADPTAVRG